MSVLVVWPLIFSSYPSNVEFLLWGVALHWACVRGHVDVAKLLLSRGANMACLNSEKWSPIHYAAEKDQVKVLQQLLAFNGNLNIVGNNGWTPLHLAAAEGHSKVRYLRYYLNSKQFN